jgi:hypothetical protein
MVQLKGDNDMKTKLFSQAIRNRNKLRFIYEMEEIVVDPYYLTVNKLGDKVVFGRVSSSNEVKQFQYNRIYNIKVLDYTKFSPIIPILPIAS